MNSKCTVVKSETKLLFITVESLTFWSVKAFTPETKRTMSLILSHKMTFPTKAKMINVQKKALDWCMGLLLDYSPWPCRAQCTWQEIPLLWMSVMRDKCSCLDSREKGGVLMYVKRGYVNREVGTSFGWVNNRQIRELIVFWEDKRVLRKIWQKEKKRKLRKSAIKPGTSWCSENNSVSTQLLASDVRAGQKGIHLRGPTADLWPQRLGNHDSCR